MALEGGTSTAHSGRHARPARCDAGAGRVHAGGCRRRRRGSPRRSESPRPGAGPPCRRRCPRTPRQRLVPQGPARSRGRSRHRHRPRRLAGRRAGTCARSPLPRRRRSPGRRVRRRPDHGHAGHGELLDGERHAEPGDAGDGDRLAGARRGARPRLPHRGGQVRRRGRRHRRAPRHDQDEPHARALGRRKEHGGRLARGARRDACADRPGVSQRLSAPAGALLVAVRADGSCGLARASEASCRRRACRARPSVFPATARRRVRPRGTRPAARAGRAQAWSPPSPPPLSASSAARRSNSLSIRGPSRSTTSIHQPFHSKCSAGWGIRPNQAIVMPAAVW